MNGLLLAALVLLVLSSSSKRPDVKVRPGQGRLTKAQLVDLALDAGFPDPNLAAAVAMAESGGDPGAIGLGPKERSIGLWQINTLVHKPPLVSDEAGLKVPKINAHAAYAIYVKAGRSWKPWGAYTNGSYKKYL
jgi:hypothetical protein